MNGLSSTYNFELGYQNCSCKVSVFCTLTLKPMICMYFKANDVKIHAPNFNYKRRRTVMMLIIHIFNSSI